MPSLGITMTEGTILEWVKREGDSFQSGDVLLTVETDKAAADVSAVFAGSVWRIVAPEQSVVAVGGVIAYLLQAGEAAPPAGWEPESPPAAAPPAAPAPAGAAPRPAAPPAAAAGPGGPASPRARRVAAELGLDLARVPGSGPGGRITEEDVRAAAATPAPGAGTLIPHTRVRAVTARRMAESARTVARVTLFAEADLDPAASWRRQDGGAVPYDLIFARAAARALRRHPALAARWHDDGLLLADRIDVGIAVATDDGLIVPVLRDTDSRPLADLLVDFRDLIGRAENGRLRPEEMDGGVFTITNLGGYGIAAFTPIVNPPQAAILGVGAVREVPVVAAGRLAVGRRAWLSLSFDHRVTDGVPAAQFLQAVIRLVATPGDLL